MKGRLKAITVILLAVLLPVAVMGKDFGLVLDQSAGYGGISGEEEAEYSGVLIPRFSTLLGNNGELYASAGLMAEYRYEEWSLVPELLRTELTWNLDFGDLRLGRMYYADPLGYIAGGLFDGARITADTGSGSFSGGAWYTGFQYKGRANIAMTAGEVESYQEKLDYGDFFGTYFAPQRVIAAFDWEHPNIWRLLQAKVTLLGQFDLSGENLHTQYGIFKLTLPVDAFSFDLGGSLGLAEADGELGIGFTAEARAGWTLPTPFGSHLALLGRYTGGDPEGSVAPGFTPITTKSQGSILKAKVSGTTIIGLDYSARLHRTLSLVISDTYFIRNDTWTYAGYLGGEEAGNFLGNEISGRVYWSPVSDIQVSLGGGVFLPSLGNVAPDSEIMWRAELGVVLSLF